MSSPQVCTRCRKRRIRCDLQLPSCKNCRLADVECLFWDDVLSQEIPCSYLHSLQQRLSDLKRDIAALSAHEEPPAREIGVDNEAVQPPDHHSIDDYHLWHTDAKGPADYLGPGSSARFAEHLFREVQPPPQSNASRESASLLFEPSHEAPKLPLWRFSLAKSDLYTVVPPSTQRALAEHYQRVVAPAYAGLLPNAQVARISAWENPLKNRICCKNSSDNNACTAVFAIAATLAARDLDPALLPLSVRCREDLHRLTIQPHRTPIVATTAAGPATPSIESLCWQTTALCALAVCEAIQPTAGHQHLWTLLGAATSMLAELADLLDKGEEDVAADTLGCGRRRHQELEQTLWKLEMEASLHFRRPSVFCEVQLAKRRIKPAAEGTDNGHDELDEMDALRYVQILRNLIHQRYPNPEHGHETAASLNKTVETALPPSLQSVFHSPEEPAANEANGNLRISPAVASIYVALHPLLQAPLQTDTCASRLVSHVQKGALISISHFVKCNDEHSILSLWMAAERVMEAGLAWVLCQTWQQKNAQNDDNGRSSARAASMRPILQVSRLLASFAARWKDGMAYVDVWEALVERWLSTMV